MGFGHLSPEQKRVVKKFVARRVVHDLGAGDLELAQELLTLKASSVVAIDTLHSYRTKSISNVRCVSVSFTLCVEEPRTAFISWPQQYGADGLGALLWKAKTIIYLGSNMDGIACGGDDFWDEVVDRRVLAHVPHRHNTLIVYGAKCGERPMLPEELAAREKTHIMYFNDAYEVEETVRVRA